MFASKSTTKKRFSMVRKCKAVAATLLLSMPTWAQMEASKTLSPIEQQTLAQLDDIILPEPIGWWPISLELWVASVFVVLSLVVFVGYLRIRFKRNAYRRVALIELLEIKHSEHDLSPGDLTNHVTSLLKRCYITGQVGQRHNVTQLYGAKLFQYFSGYLTTSKSFLEHFNDWEKMAYQSSTNNESGDLSADPSKAALLEFASVWIKKHRRLASENNRAAATAREASA